MSDFVSLYSGSSVTLLAQAQEGTGGGPNMLLFFILLIAAMYFLLIAPQRKRQKEMAKMISEVGSGDEVMTAGGLYGTVTNVKADRFVVKIAENTKVEVNKNHIVTVVNKDN